MVVACEVKTTAEYVVKQACTLISGLLHDCQFSSLENRMRSKKGIDSIFLQQHLTLEGRGVVGGTSDQLEVFF